MAFLRFAQTVIPSRLSEESFTVDFETPSEMADFTRALREHGCHTRLGLLPLSLIVTPANVNTASVCVQFPARVPGLDAPPKPVGTEMTPPPK